MSAALPLLAIVISYVLGSIPTGLWLGQRLRGIDIREHGSKNIGATNTLRVLGKKLGALALAGDMAKGLVPVLFGIWLQGYFLREPSEFILRPLHEYVPLLCGLAAILGHLFPVFLEFNGGKGVATSTGVYLGLAPIPTICAAVVFALVVAATRMVSAGSLSAAAALAIGVFVLPFSTVLRAITVVIAVLVFVKHRSNLDRILRGEESRIGER